MQLTSLQMPAYDISYECAVGVVEYKSSGVAPEVMPVGFAVRRRTDFIVKCNIDLLWFEVEERASLLLCTNGRCLIEVGSKKLWKGKDYLKTNSRRSRRQYYLFIRELRLRNP